MTNQFNSSPAVDQVYLRVFATADLHIMRAHRAWPMGDNGLNEILNRQKEIIDQFCDEFEQSDYDLAVIAGDVTDYPKIEPEVLELVSYLIRRLGQSGKPSVIIEGNHCITDSEGRYTVLAALSDLAPENVHIVTQRSRIYLEEICAEVWCYPYVSGDHEVYGEMLMEDNECARESEHNTVMVFHFPTSNAVLDNGLRAPQKGFHLKEELIDGFDICIGGDYHKPQRLIGTSRAYYCGAPMDLKFGESHDRVFRDFRLTDDGLVVVNVPVEGNRAFLTLSFEDYESKPEVYKRHALRFSHELSEAQVTRLEEDGVFVYRSMRQKTPQSEEALEGVDAVSFGDYHRGNDFDHILERTEGVSEEQSEFLRGLFEQKIKGE